MRLKYGSSAPALKARALHLLRWSFPQLRQHLEEGLDNERWWYEQTCMANCAVKATFKNKEPKASADVSPSTRHVTHMPIPTCLLLTVPERYAKVLTVPECYAKVPRLATCMPHRSAAVASAAGSAAARSSSSLWWVTPTFSAPSRTAGST